MTDTRARKVRATLVGVASALHTLGIAAITSLLPVRADEVLVE